MYGVWLPTRRSAEYSRNRGYALAIRSLDRGSVYVLQRYRLTDSQDFGLVEERRVSADELRIANALPPPALGLLTLRRADETRDASSPTRRARTAVQR